MTKLQVVIGSTRPERAAERVFPWVLDRARDHGAFDVELVDLRDWPLPFFAETAATVGDFNDPTYSVPIVREWNRKIAEADAYLFITPEYNHSVPGVLQNAIDWISRPAMKSPLAEKPAAIMGVSPGALGAARAQQQLKLVLMATLAQVLPHPGVSVGLVAEKFDAEGRLVHEPTRQFVSAYLAAFETWIRRVGRPKAAERSVRAA